MSGLVSQYPCCAYCGDFGEGDGGPGDLDGEMGGDPGDEHGAWITPPAVAVRLNTG